jgi:hypothetical protein
VPLHAELLIAAMFWFSADVGHTGFLVFKDVEYFTLHCGVLDFVVWKRGVELLLLCSVRSALMEAGYGEQRFGVVVCFHAGAAGKEATPLAAKMRIRLEVVIFVFMVCCPLTAYDL